MTESKRDCIRRVARENNVERVSNQRMIELVRKLEGREVLASDVIHAIGTTKARTASQRPAIFAAIQRVFDECGHDIRLVRYYFGMFANKWADAKQNPEVKP